MPDDSFAIDDAGLKQAIDTLRLAVDSGDMKPLPAKLPETGLGEAGALEMLAPTVLGGAQRLGAPHAFAHMDPPTPWVSWAATLWNASLNQNLLHPDVAPVARDLEHRLIGWLAPSFGMDGGHTTPGSSIANLTALWAARELQNVTRVVASEDAHLSVAKAAHILGLAFQSVPTDETGMIDAAKLPVYISDAALVLTAGATSTGAIDDLGLAGRAAWTHVDAAWAGPLVLSEKHAHRLKGIEQADSVAVSAHKWFFQPKDSGLIFFRDSETAHRAVSFGGAYLAVPNVGVLGSHGAIAAPLMATLLAWGRTGLAERIDRCMAMAPRLSACLASHPNVELFGPPVTGVVLWRPRGGADIDAIFERLPTGSASRTKVGGRAWIRHVAANPNADIDLIWTAIEQALAQSGSG